MYLNTLPSTQLQYYLNTKYWCWYSNTFKEYLNTGTHGKKNNQDLSKISQLLLIATVQFDSNINKMSP